MKKRPSPKAKRKPRRGAKRLSAKDIVQAALTPTVTVKSYIRNGKRVRGYKRVGPSEKYGDVTDIMVRKDIATDIARRIAEYTNKQESEIFWMFMSPDKFGISI